MHVIPLMETFSCQSECEGQSLITHFRGIPAPQNGVMHALKDQHTVQAAETPYVTQNAEKLVDAGRAGLPFHSTARSHEEQRNMA
jgi:hypothetical protein